VDVGVLRHRRVQQEPHGQGDGHGLISVTTTSACERVITRADLDAACNCQIDSLNLTTTEIDDILDSACDTLANIAQLPVGRCAKTYRPCRDYCRYFNCDCCGPQGIPLPGINPTVTAVKIDGALVSAGSYMTLRSPGGMLMLERFEPDGTPALWPHWQRVTLPDSQPDTFSISLTAGIAATDKVMVAAAAEIACDIVSHYAHERETTDGLVAASGFGISMDFRRFGDPTDQETQNLAGLNWLRRFVVAHGGGRPGAIWCPELDNGWTLYESWS
jgi:hypothetical protein